MLPTLGAYRIAEQLDALARDAAVQKELTRNGAQVAPCASKWLGKGCGGS